MSDLQNAFDNLIEKQRELIKQFQETARGLFNDITKEFFKKNPGVNAVIWTQTIPYFNDGDPCEFNVYAPTFTNAIDEDDLDMVLYDYDGDNEDIWAEDNLNWIFNSDDPYYDDRKALIRKSGPIDIASCEQFAKMIQCIDMEPIMRSTFGEHVKVIATRKGFTVEEYTDHD